jgi:hypothetical protein
VRVCLRVQLRASRVSRAQIEGMFEGVGGGTCEGIRHTFGGELRAIEEVHLRVSRRHV